MPRVTSILNWLSHKCPVPIHSRSLRMGGIPQLQTRCITNAPCPIHSCSLRMGGKPQLQIGLVHSPLVASQMPLVTSILNWLSHKCPVPHPFALFANGWETSNLIHPGHSMRCFVSCRDFTACGKNQNGVARSVRARLQSCRICSKKTRALAPAVCFSGIADSGGNREFHSLRKNAKIGARSVRARLQSCRICSKKTRALAPAVRFPRISDYGGSRGFQPPETM
jgi:hypothetical protein